MGLPWLHMFYYFLNSSTQWTLDSYERGNPTSLFGYDVQLSRDFIIGLMSRFTPKNKQALNVGAKNSHYRKMYGLRSLNH